MSVLRKVQMQTTKILLILLLIFFLTIQSTFAFSFLDYLIDRGNDFIDIFRIRFSIAPKAKAIGVHARATCLAQIGFIYFDGHFVGMDRRAFGVWNESKMEGGISALYYTDIESDAPYGNSFLDENTQWFNITDRGLIRNDIYWDDGRYHPVSIGVEAQLAILPGVDIGVYPEEIVDFIWGLFTFDFWQDDVSKTDVQYFDKSYKD